MPTYKLTAVQKISITADIKATSREQAIERFADFLHGWINRANEERTATGKQPRDPAFSLLEIDENEGGWTIFDQADSGEPVVKGFAGVETLGGIDDFVRHAIRFRNRSWKSGPRSRISP